MPVVVQCPLTSSLYVNFQAIGTGSGILGYRQCVCSLHRRFPLAFHIISVISVFFHSLFTCRWISFGSALQIRMKLFCTHSIDHSLADGEFSGLGLALMPDVVAPEAEHGMHMKQKSCTRCK